jgi:hypothetical protein
LIPRLPAIASFSTLMACAIGPNFAPPNQPTANAFAKAFLNSLQPQSFAERREFCGYFYTASDGSLQATPPTPGDRASCGMNEPDANAGIFAVYHTHGAYDVGYDNEIPSSDDLKLNFDLGLDGYIATPGGRIWHVEVDDQTARQVCGRNCVRSDPWFVAEDESSIRQSYTLQQIEQRINGDSLILKRNPGKSR